MTTLWGAAAVIVAGYVMGFYFQNRRLDDLRTHVDKRFDDLYRYIDLRFSTLEERIGVKP